MDTVVRSLPSEPEAPKVVANDKPNEQGAEPSKVIEEPLDNAEGAILSSIGIEDNIKNLPVEDADNLKEIDGYLRQILKSKGVVPTQSSIGKELTSLKEEMGLVEESEPSIVLDRIGGVLKAWKDLSFITNPSEKRSLFMKLANATTSKDMNRIVFEEMNRKAIWR